MNNNILKIRNDLFFLSQKKNVPENRHEKRRDYQTTTLIDRLLLNY